ncbi:transcriptional regulator domain-containing protein [Shinella zoogloeoides]|uniref:transcriptional regulator domain-containing protein n=1 Tax=Shinella zoogloeoides TaxID=352475 RepID=UPI001E3915E2|nr:DUF6499 domain-containing protein [Shinella zoogloeoides]UEX81658.1 DUF6499 domain-containing protein [Shinella zoogloeoides]
MLNIDWRSAAEYRHTKSIPAAGFAWEYLRRDGDYHREFHAITRIREPSAEQLATFTRNWGLQFRRRSRDTRRPAIPLLATRPSPSSHRAVTR